MSGSDTEPRRPVTVRLVPRPIRRFWRIAWQANLTGMASMLAYTLLYAVIPIALLALFVAGKVLASKGVQHSVLVDLRKVFPGASPSTLNKLITEVRNRSTSSGVLALVSSLWLGSSVWGAMDTAFSRVYGYQARSWFKQKRFSLSMVFVSLVFMVATVAVPTLQSFLESGARSLPFDLGHVGAVVYATSVALGLIFLFVSLVTIYYRVPHFRVPWRGVWPGALGATLAIGVVDQGFPIYLTHISTIARFGTTVVFIIIVVSWFYVLAIIILSGAVVNTLRLRPPQPGE